MTIKISYARLSPQDWRPKMPARDVERLARFNLGWRYASSRGGVTQVSIEVAGLDISTRIVCSAEDNFCRKEGRARAIKSLIEKLRQIGLWGTAHHITELYFDDLEWLLFKDEREAQERIENAVHKAQQDAENKACGLARQAEK